MSMHASSKGSSKIISRLAYLSSSSFKKFFTFSVTLKPPKSQSLLCRPQCDVDAGEDLPFLGSCSRVAGLIATGETSGSDPVLIACEGLVGMEIGAVLGREFGGEEVAPGDFDLEREWEMASVGCDRDNGNGKEWDRECERVCEVGDEGSGGDEVVVDVDKVLTSAAGGVPAAVVLRCTVVALESNEEAFGDFMFPVS